ncbi:MAG: glycoside hydrolase [Bifidobacterium breve]|nr:glycoside hydrolase [Bifidobacterium breve]
MEFTVSGTTVRFDERTMQFAFTRDGAEWNTCADFKPTLQCTQGTFAFADATSITHEQRETGTGTGIRSIFTGFGHSAYSFETYVWVERASGDVLFEWIPLNEQGLTVTGVTWPAAIAFDRDDSHDVTLITHEQGVMIPNTWPTAVSTKDITFDGRFETAGGYMPWFAQLRADGHGYIAICETPWNAGYGIRSYVNERGRLRTLAEKAARNPSVRDLIGRSWVHVGIKTKVQPDSFYYDKNHPEKNDSLVTFAQREKQMRTLHGMGAGRLYMHLDGWAQPGYDNAHPDYLPACQEAGGWEGMKSLIDTCHEQGDIFGTHDQYRDYYFTAQTFDANNAIRLADGTMPEHARWAGGHQTYLCAELAPDYVRRNFTQIAAHGIKLDCAYLDVFTCNEGDECSNPEHRMTRRECFDRRAECFEYLLSHGILSSSEEVSDWAVPSLVFCHYAPYDFQMRSPNEPRQGVPVPLYNLVYHDCVIEPWMMERVVDGDDYMLYALLNGGAPYLIRDAAYIGVDGDMDDEQRARTENDIERCHTVAAFHERVGMQELVRHEFVDDDPLVQRSVFADGTAVTCDFHTQTYRITDCPHR